MTDRAKDSATSTEAESHARLTTRDTAIGSSLKAARLLAVSFMLVDASEVIVRAIAPSPGRPFRWTGLVLTLLGVTATIALLWWRPRIAALTGIPVFAVAITKGSLTGAEGWITVIGCLMVGARCSTRLIAVTVAATGGAAIWLVAITESAPAGVVTFGILTTALAIGRAARRLLSAHEQGERRIAQVAADNATIRTRERAQLGAELRELAAARLRSARSQVAGIDAVDDLAELRARLAGVETDMREVLTDLRRMLDLLRATQADDSQPSEPSPTSVLGRLSLPRVRLAATIGAALGGPLSALTLGHVLGTTGAGQLGVSLAVVAAITLWAYPRIGPWVAVVALVASLVDGSPFWAAALAVAVLGVWSVATGVVGRRLLVLCAGLSVYWLALTLPEDRLVVTWAYGTGIAALVSVVGALIGGALLRSRRRALAALAGLRREQDDIPRDERLQLAREVHDVLGHELSVAALHALAASGAQEALHLRRSLHDIAASIDGADTELDALVHALHANAVTDRTPEVLLSPTVMAARMHDQLRAHSHPVTMQVDPACDRLDPMLQRTLSRILQESTTNILRHGGSNVASSYAVRVDESAVTLQITNPVALGETESPRLGSGHGLRGIEERVDLSGGYFEAGPEGTRWVVRATLPRHT